VAGWAFPPFEAMTRATQLLVVSVLLMIIKHWKRFDNFEFNLSSREAVYDIQKTANAHGFLFDAVSVTICIEYQIGEVMNVSTLFLCSTCRWDRTVGIWVWSREKRDGGPRSQLATRSKCVVVIHALCEAIRE
jgi:hypothetical protein